ncbi:MAG: type II toxin-antitoxin system VapC family toxin [Bryobacteraceae bacterium]
MSWLLDTNVLLRLADEQSSEHAVAETAIEDLIAHGESVFISTQILVEFWAVATRPESTNGLGWSTATAADAIRALRDQFPLLDDAPEVLDRWFELVHRGCRQAYTRRPIGGFAVGAWIASVTDVQHERLPSRLGRGGDAPCHSSARMTKLAAGEPMWYAELLTIDKCQRAVAFEAPAALPAVEPPLQGFD